MTLKGCGLLETPYNFFIDHLAPLCALLEIPILSSDVRTKLLYQNYYPEIEFILKRWSISYLIENFSHILYSFVPEPSFKTIVNQEKELDPTHSLWKKNTQFIYHLHGCSDKGYHSTWIDPKGHICDVDLLLIYGPRMEELLRYKQLLDKPKKYLHVGNYRYLYYLKHKSFFDEKAYCDIFSKFKRDQPVLLYAPTWEDHEKSCSFFDLALPLCTSLSNDFNILIKLHPNMTLERKGYDPSPILKLIYKLAKIPNVLVLPFYPLIYPLIEQSSFYLGDFSSVGYDVLAFEKPMFFFNHLSRSLDDPGAYLHRCGVVLQKNQIKDLKKEILGAIERGFESYRSIQRTVYSYAFGDNASYPDLQTRLKSHFLTSE
jgi:hypothetical protein